MHRLTLLILPVLLAAGIPPLHAALPPSAYEKMQDEAPEHLNVEILRVEQRAGESENETIVTATAMVESVTRSATELAPDDMITIRYTVTRRPPGFVGPAQTPILKEGARTVAYLEKIPNAMDYAPAAQAMSFSDF